MKLSIIIVNYNVKYFLEQCLCSVKKAIKELQAEIIVVDNASSDGSMEYLLAMFTDITFIDNPKNVGFARACNQGLKQAKGAYILFLNPDTIVSEDCLTQCINFLEADSQSGACGVQMLDGSGRFLPESKRAFPSLQTSFYKLSGLTRLFPHSKRFARYYLGNISENKDQQIDVLSGAFFMVKKEVLSKTGGFDEQFFMYGEDIDLSYRIQQAGYKNHYLASPKIIHFKGESTKKGSLNYVKLFYKAMSLFVRKHYKKNNAAKVTIFIQMSIWFRAGITAIRSVMSKEKEGTVKNSLNTMVIGTEQETRSAVSILARQHQQRDIIPLKKGAGWEKQTNLEMPDEIIFCEGELTFKQIIDRIKELPSAISFKIHSKGSASIVGSSSKNTSGNVLA